MSLPEPQLFCIAGYTSMQTDWIDDFQWSLPQGPGEDNFKAA